ncbi:MAG: polysaccharide biosynthesis/export family protein [Verrucomicrobia bacterium]|nr:polysaccharide biosynthesis/export family protein [Verrucomicrobiota bacterium]MBV8275438.1 polysaccharide biosynthesis/export family protein [Verrucomicrobiota bacterium]
MTRTRCLRSIFLATLLLSAWFPASSEEFILRPSDTVQLKIGGVPAEDAKAVTGEYVIDGQGYVNMPNLGRIKIGGLTLSAAQTVIEAAYRSHDIYTRPTITITLGTMHRWVNVGGAVKIPQRIAYKPDLTVLATIDAAGGFSSSADQQKVRLLRADEVMIIDTKKIRGNPSLDIPLEPGDSIEVPREEPPLLGGRN